MFEGEQTFAVNQNLARQQDHIDMGTNEYEREKAEQKFMQFINVTQERNEYIYR